MTIDPYQVWLLFRDIYTKTFEYELGAGWHSPEAAERAKVAAMAALQTAKEHFDVCRP